MEEAELLEEKKAKAAKKLGHTTSESGEKATPNVKSPALSQGAHRIRVVDSVAYPPKDAVTTTQKNLIFWGKSLPLYSIIDVPHWQRYNPAIRGSYRAFYNTSMTIKSFLGWHNETLNIWTHFVGFLLFLYLTYFLCTRTLQWGGSFSSYLNSAPIFYYLFCLGCMACTICSTIYHLFTGHCNCKLMVLMGRIDFVGITFLIIGSFLPPLYVLLHCFPMIRNIYLTASIVLGAATSFACWTDTFFEHVGLRVGLFVGLAVSGVGPLIHLLFMVPFSDTMASIVYGILLMLALYGSGVVFYVTRFPEAWFPAHFDCFLSSHQIWHYFVMMAAIVHFFNCTSIYQMYTMSDGNC